MKKLLSGALAVIMLAALCLSAHAATSAQISAKRQLIEVLPAYERCAERVTLDDYKANAEFQNYVNTLLPRARTYASESSYRPATVYSNLIDKLEQSWMSWRAQMPLSAGMYTYRDAILNQVGASSQYDRTLYNKFQAVLTPAINMIDDIKNNLYATDYDGQQAIRALQNLVYELKSGSITSTAQLFEEKANLIQTASSFRQELKKDTNTPLKAETLTFKEMIQSGVMLVGSADATKEETSAYSAKLNDYYFNTFQPALFIGNAFIKKAREAYSKVAPDADLYTSESWSAVSNAIDHCDMVKNSWHTDKDCLAAYSNLLNAIDRLQLKEIKIYPITVSQQSANAGDEITVTVTLDKNSDMIYGNFKLQYDATVLEYIHSSEEKTRLEMNAVSFRYEDVTNPCKDEYVWSLTFKVKDYALAGVYPLTLTCEKLRDSRGALIQFETTSASVEISSQNKKGDMDDSGQVGLNDVITIARIILDDSEFSEKQKYLADMNYSGDVTVADIIWAARTNLGDPLQLPTDYTVVFDDGEAQTTATGQMHATCELPPIPEKAGYVFHGWYTEDGRPAKDGVFICGGQTLNAKWKVFEPGPLRKDEVSVGGFVSIHNAYAVEDDFYMLAECGIDFIILDYTHNDAISEQCLHWAEKYGVKVLIHDYALNALSTFTVNEVKSLTSAYSSSPAFAGNDLWDEPHYAYFPEIAQKMDVYTQALPGYDLHVNLLTCGGVEELVGISFEDYANRFVSTVTTSNHFCIDPYPLLDVGGKRKIFSKYYQGLRQGGITSRDNGLDYWVYIQTMAGVSANVYPDLTDLRFQAYACLAFGASKIIHYCYDVPGYTPDSSYSAQVYAMRDYAHNYTKLWDYGQILHTELDTLAQAYEAYAYNETYAYKTAFTPEYLAPVPTYTAKDISCNTPLLIGTFDKKEGSGKAIMLTNASEPEAKDTATVTFTANSDTVTVYSDGLCKTLQPTNGVYTITLDPGAGALITLE